jgi:hypothetical protein
MSVSGRQLHAFRNGWACVFGTFGLAHYFRRVGVTDEVIASCGLRAPVRAMWGVGTFPTCRKCRKKHGPPTDRRTCVDGTPLEWMASR